ncbi:hypothetical protein [Elizabethkingia ursingii]|uniref:Uncharacterized protein n=1 Tax=Elizabethkingia ursingii TaxID=1756150 RepID=A0AAJ3NBF9_9FLAO|nr:hypothetical protein [Elizabethkingia ursingii]AQX09189.1 hypothetical protein BBD34_11290 [Elizabethkingia ursingii]OPB74442.1 hypothetical protein BAY32_08900 [Elizabethkingia ursingii]OPB93391.1 hypothetical protein BB021_03110 [Elizabethkingia ursingii]
MKIPFYYSFKEFEKRHMLDYVDLRNTGINLIDYFDSIGKLYLEKKDLYRAMNHIALIDDLQMANKELYWSLRDTYIERHGVILNEYNHYGNLGQFKSYIKQSLCSGIDEIITYAYNKYLEFSIININNGNAYKETNSSKIKVRGSLQSLGYVFSELIEKGYIVPPRRNGNINVLATARMILEHFEFADREQQPNEEDIRKTLFTDNRLSTERQSLFKIPGMEKLNTN